MPALGLRARWAIGTLALAAVLGAASVAVVRTVVASRLRGELRERGLLLARALADDCLDLVLTGNTAGLRMLLFESRAAEPEVEYLLVLDGEGAVLAHTFAGGVPAALPGVHAPPRDRAHSVLRLRTERGVLLDIAVPLLGGAVGVLRAGVSQMRLEADVESLTGTILWMVLAVVVAGALASLALSVPVTRRLTALTAAARVAGEGRLGVRVPEGAADEIGQLGAAFNRMLAARAEAERAVRQRAEVQARANRLLRLSWNDEPIDELLGRALDVILSPPLASPCGPGAIALLEGDPPAWVVRAGRPAGAGARARVEAIGERCAPIRWGDRLLGELRLVAAPDEPDGQSLALLADALAGVIARVRAEQERRAAEEHLERTRKLQAIATLAGGLAHDIGNLVAAADGHAERALRCAGGDATLGASLGGVRAAMRRASGLLDQLRLFGGRGPERLAPVDVNRVVEDVLDVFAGLPGTPLEVRRGLCPGLPAVVADAAALEQIVMNLLANARDAMPGGGTLTVRTELSRPGPEQCRDHPRALPDAYVRITVADTGPGIDEATRRRMFEPLFSTGPAGRRSGLGLAIVQALVERLDGWIDVDSAPGRGAAFHVHLLAFGPRDPARGAPGVSAHRGGGRLLLVEDEPAVREFAAAALREGGYRVTEAAGVKEAVAAFERERDLCALVSDVTLPGGDGLALADRLRARVPGLAVVLTSAHVIDGARVAAIRERGLPLLVKPYSAGDLARAVGDALARAGA